jgi:hypothetical protein
LAWVLGSREKQRATIKKMENDLYLLASLDNSGGRYKVRRNDDLASVGSITRTGDGWSVDDAPEGYPIVFETRDDAAEFLCMKGRAYQFEISDGPDRIEVRVVPNFGQRWGCRIGQWVAMLYDDKGDAAGVDRCADSVLGAKRSGVQQACLYRQWHFEELMQIVEGAWRIVVDTSTRAVGETR